MALFDVVQPCIVAGKHYTRPRAGVEIDESEARPFVESGLLVPHAAPEPVADGSALAEVVGDQPEPEGDQPEPEGDTEPPRRSGRAR